MKNLWRIDSDRIWMGTGFKLLIINTGWFFPTFSLSGPLGYWYPIEGG